MAEDMSSALLKAQIFDITAPNKSTKVVGGECSGILNWDDIREPKFYKLYRVMLGNHWIPDEIPMEKDAKIFHTLSPARQNAYLKTIGLLAVLDSVQTVFVGDVGAYLTDSSLQAIMGIIGQQEIVHNQSYSYCLSSVVDFDTQKSVFEYWKHDPILLERNLFITTVYQKFRDNPTPQTFFEALVMDIILEGIDFYSAFAFFYSLARDGAMLATSQMMSYIQRDEQHHVYGMAEIFKLLLLDYPELATPENIDGARKTIARAVEHELNWGRHILTDVENIDLDELAEYIKATANKRLKQMGLEKLYDVDVPENVMPWIRPFTDEALASTKTDFFEGKSRNYGKVSKANGFDRLRGGRG
ncbi:ribonucleotide-diphosphate reductase subunit beta (plasmid) [Paenibacillus sp. S-38]|uniref:ribonucleotide-diphosphate reductase subunit beta n=1 Tax=Paenibacillus sp. S-38 TaxID=3416710 RepID=UPI003CEF1B56